MTGEITRYRYNKTASALRHSRPHLFHPINKPATLHANRRLSQPREVEVIAMAFADRVLKALLVVLTKQPTDVHVVGDRNVLAAHATVIVPVVHAARS
jgi:hypothetical protein